MNANGESVAGQKTSNSGGWAECVSVWMQTSETDTGLFNVKQKELKDFGLPVGIGSVQCAPAPLCLPGAGVEEPSVWVEPFFFLSMICRGKFPKVIDFNAICWFPMMTCSTARMASTGPGNCSSWLSACRHLSPCCTLKHGKREAVPPPQSLEARWSASR